MNKVKTYADKLLGNSDFKEDLEREYRNLVIAEKIAELRHRARLTQAELARRVRTTKSAISRYENNGYRGYSLSLLYKIAAACGADLQVCFVVRRGSGKKMAGSTVPFLT
jgi:DNA-binding XRE family transcriptional regulator